MKPKPLPQLPEPLKAPPPIRLTDEQLDWLTYRMTSGTDDLACERAGVTPADLEDWRANSVDFGRALALAAESDTRDVFRQLSAGLLPHALRVLRQLLASPNPRAQKDGLTLLLKAQGLLDQPTTGINGDQLEELISRLRQPRPVKILDVTPRE